MPTPEELDQALEGIESTHYRRSLGILIKGAAQSNLQAVDQMRHMIRELEVSSRENALIGKRLWWLTIAIALSAVVQGAYYGFMLVQEVTK